jgi:Ser/Thr protein kinase RdoA (MazF antagonist)
MIDTIISHFAIPGTFLKADRFGSGLINDTYLCEFKDHGTLRKYILQHINTSVFKRPDLVMENVELVTSHIVNKLRAEGMPDPYDRALMLIHTRNGRSYHTDHDNGFWRAFHFIESCAVFDRVTDTKHAFEIGRGLGMFQALVADLLPERLHDTLPGFHRTPQYLQELDDVLRVDAQGRAKEVENEIAFAGRKRLIAPLLTDLVDSHQIPLRVVHNDPKVNNVLIHSVTGKAVCMVDLDTVKPGSVLFDFGDCVRSAANPSGEDAENLQTVSIDLALFEAVAGGYLHEARGFLTKKEIEMLPVSVKVITFELGLRFVTDYLRGDRYFKIKYPDHNLHRARVQFRLLESIETNGKRMQYIIRDILSRTNVGEK